jgi:hypothetical protein
MTASRRPSRRLVVALAAFALAALVAFVLVWLQPQNLLIDDRVDEAPTRRPRSARARPRYFAASSTPTHNRARVIEVGSRRYVRFESFRTSNGPLLKGYLSAARPEGPGGEFDDATSTSARSRAMSATELRDPTRRRPRRVPERGRLVRALRRAVRGGRRLSRAPARPAGAAGADLDRGSGPRGEGRVRSVSCPRAPWCRSRPRSACQ